MVLDVGPALSDVCGSESQSTAAIARGVRAGGGRGSPDISLEFISRWVNERNQPLFWGFYRDCENLIFYHHVTSCSGNLFTVLRERPGLFGRE